MTTPPTTKPTTPSSTATTEPGDVATTTPEPGDITTEPSKPSDDPSTTAESEPTTEPTVTEPATTAPTTGAPSPTTPVTATPSTVMTRLWGKDRYATAVAVSRAQWKDGQAHGVVLARGDDYSDALAGIPLAAHIHGPLLLSDPKALDASVEQEITRVLGAPQWGGTVHILGGDQAISPAVEAKLVADGYHVVRDAGSTRYSTALQIAKEFGSGTEVMVANGSGYADAISAGPLGAVRNAPLLLSDGTNLDPETAAFVAQHSVVDGIGKPAVDALQKAGVNHVTPLWGDDKYATSRAVAGAVAQSTGSEKAVGIASGRSFADGIIGGAYSANLGMPLLLVDPKNADDATLGFLHGWLPQLVNVDVFGGESAVPQGFFSQVQSTLHATVS